MRQMIDQLHQSLLIISIDLQKKLMQKQGKRKQKINTKPEYKNLTPFKEMEKHFKLYHGVQTDFSSLFEPKQYITIEGYEIAHLPFPEGAILVRSFNSAQIAQKIAAEALNIYCYKPYRTNLNSRDDLYKQENEVSNLEEKQQIQEKPENGQSKGYIFNDKIRWANVGYQYDWTERKYPNMKTQIPPTINQLCVRANKLYNAIQGTTKEYMPQSAIINYYSEKDYMTGHLDDAQIDQTSPIYSFSFGLSCIFLMGGRSKQQKPVSVRLNSGDLLIMGLEARKCYHGVPRVLAGTYFSQQKLQIEFEEEWLNKRENVEEYLRRHRININVRQVYPTQ